MGHRVEEKSAAFVQVCIVLDSSRHREAGPPMFHELEAWLDGHREAGELIVVHDGPAPAWLSAWAQRRPLCPVRATDAGPGRRLMQAVAASHASHLIVIENGACSAADLDLMLAKLREGKEMVFGVREANPASPRGQRRDPLLSWLMRRLFSTQVHDASSGVHAFRRNAFDRLDLRCTGIESDLELTIKTQLFGLATTEVPIHTPDADSGEGGDGGGQRTWRDRWRRLRFVLLYKPRWLLLLPGLIMAALGLTGSALALAGATLAGVTLDAHTLAVSCALVLVGYQSILFSIIAKTFAITEGLMPQDPRLTRLYAFLNLERGLILGALTMLAGVALIAVAVGKWHGVDYGRLDYASTMRWVLPGVTLIALGFQTVLWGAFASIMGVGRRDSKSMTATDLIHDSFIHNRRVRVLCDHLSRVLPPGARVLDVGSGDGLLASLIMARRPDLRIVGIDVEARPGTHIPVKEFDGTTIPYDAKSFDVVMFVDVLHHTNDPEVLLREAARVASQWVVLKDHTRNGLLAGPTLRFMDRVGNLRHSVPLPYNYWPRGQWREAFERLRLHVAEWVTDLRLYPIPADWVFGRSLHFVAKLKVPD